MNGLVILGASIILQLAAAVLSLRLIPVTGKRRAWVLIALAVTLMALRRCITFVKIAMGVEPHSIGLFSEWVTVATSVLMLFGIYWIGPLFHGIQDANMALAESESRYRKLFEDCRDAIVVADEHGGFIDANAAALELFKCDREAIRGMKLEHLAIDPRELTGFQAEMDREGMVKDCPLRLRQQDGREVCCLASWTLKRDEQGRILGQEGFVRDVTDQRRLEEQFRQAQKMEAVGRLAGGIAHDFNNLLTATMGYCELLLHKLNKEDSAYKYAEGIRDSAEKSARLTRQLLLFSSQKMLQPRIIDLNTVVASMERILRRLIGEDVALDIKLHSEPCFVEADPSHLEQVIMNLALNSRDAMPNGGSLIIETRHADLDEICIHKYATVQPGSYVALTVNDTGVGMDENAMAHIFEPFFTTKEKGKGTGLGLSTVYGIVKQSNGHIWAYSEPGLGSVFHVYLPRVNGADHRAVTKKDQGAAALDGSETVLLVEDEGVVRNLIRNVLEAHGYKVLEAGDGLEALEICGNWKAEIHLLVTDVIMPGMNGRELATRLAVSRPDLKILYMSGYTEENITHHHIQQAGRAFVQKPFTPEALMCKMRETLNAR
ncbi:MAG: ATP-binding protein [Syntrophobacteraceae bacterium]